MAAAVVAAVAAVAVVAVVAAWLMAVMTVVVVVVVVVAEKGKWKGEEGATMEGVAEAEEEEAEDVSHLRLFSYVLRR